MNWIEIGIFIFITIYMWLISFLFHELAHIKSQGLGMHGRINVYKTGFTASIDEIYNRRWCRLAGGLVSGIIHLILGGVFLWQNLWYLYIPTITFGMINLVYGFWEMDHGGEGRYKIYGIVLVIMIVIWLLQYYLI